MPLDSANPSLQDDRQSLVELHHYLSNDTYLPESNDGVLVPIDQDELASNALPYEPPQRDSRRLSDNSSILTERRRSLPVSLLSSSDQTFGDTASIKLATKPEPTDFQQRRRRAAKLTQFFGVQYRELITDVLDSLENGLQHEERRGTLQASEVADLLERLRALKVKREGIII